MPKSPKRMSANELARELEVSRMTITAWMARGMPTAVRGKGGRGSAHAFDLAAVKAWLADEGLQQKTDLDAPKNRSEADLALVLQKIRKERANADKAELSVKQRRGELLEAVDVERGRLERIATVASGLEALAGKLAARCLGQDQRAIERIVGEEVTRLREEFSGR